MNGRSLLPAGLGISFRPTERVDLYSNISQNYRSITFNDMRISNPSSVIDPDLKDETGYSFDFGIRSEATTLLNYDVSFFYLNYDNRIGEIQSPDENNRVLRKRSNIGQAIIKGIEAYGEVDVLGYLMPAHHKWSGVIFNNVAFIQSEYTKSKDHAVVGRKVEFVPPINWKAGVRFGYGNAKASFQYTYVSDQYTDATNAEEGDVSGVIGLIPSYTVVDLSLAYQYRRFAIEGSINNLTDRMYFTRRATGYPGPGILPSDGRSFYVTLQVKLSDRDNR